MRVGGSSSAALSQSAGIGNWQQRQKSFNSLSTALQSGNLGAAQAAFTSLSSTSKQNADPRSPLAQIGHALQSGNLGAAQQAFSNLVNSRSGPAATAQASASAPAAASNLGSVIDTTA
jgi:hypothetical protein